MKVIPTQAAPTLDFRGRFNQEEMTAIIGIAARAEQMWRARHVRMTSPEQSKADGIFERHRDVLTADIAVCHLFRRLDLPRFLRADDLAFMAECIEVQKNIDRGLCRFPAHVLLQFARNGARVKQGLN